MLGIGGGYKMFPLLFVLPTAFYFEEKMLARIKLIFTGFMPFILFMLPFVGSSAFRGMVFSPKSQKMLFMGWNITGAQVIYPFMLGLIIIYLIAYYSGKRYKLENYIYSILLLIFSVTHYHPQWFLWITPFVIIYLIENKYKFWEISLFFVLSWVVLTMFFEPSLSYGMFYPLNRNLQNAVGLSEIVGKYTDVNQLSSLIRSIFAGCAIFLASRFYQNYQDER